MGKGVSYKTKTAFARALELREAAQPRPEGVGKEAICVRMSCLGRPCGGAYRRVSVLQNAVLVVFRSVLRSIAPAPSALVGL